MSDKRNRLHVVAGWPEDEPTTVDRLQDEYWLAAVGSRSFTDFQAIVDRLDQAIMKLMDRHLRVCLVSGGAAGADKMVRDYAAMLGVSAGRTIGHVVVTQHRLFEDFPIRLVEFLPDIGAHARASAAMWERNHLVVKHSDGMLAFLDDKSKGARGTAVLMEKAGKPVRRVLS